MKAHNAVFSDTIKVYKRNILYNILNVFRHVSFIYVLMYTVHGH